MEMEFEKVDVLDISKWFMNRHEDIASGSFNGNVKLQKLLYYTQVMSIAVTGEGIFTNNIEAWKHGPVIAEAFRFYSHDFDKIKNRKININKADEKLLKVINSLFGFKTAKELENISHKEKPWLELKDEVDKRSNPIITKEKIKNYYKNMKNIFETFSDFDFDNEKAEYINSNVFVYNKKDLELTDDDRMILYDIAEQVDNESFYVYKEDEKLVVY